MGLLADIIKQFELLPRIVQTIAYAGGAALVALGLKLLVFSVIGRVRDVEDPQLLDRVMSRVTWPANILAPLMAVVGVLELHELRTALSGTVSLILQLTTIGVTAWLVIGILRGMDDHVSENFSGDSARERRFRTQARIVRRFVSITLLMLAGLGMLMAIPQVRSFGFSLAASAGVAGIIVALIARPVLANVVAGVQLAFQEPFEIGDMIKVEDEVGWIEDIHWTYVVVRRWDERRAVIPLSRFVDDSYENWSFHKRELIALATVYTDYTAPIDELREALETALKDCEHYDGGDWGIDVIEATEYSVKIRAKAEIEDPTKCWAVEFFMREALIDALNERGATALPRQREQHIDHETEAAEETAEAA